MNVTCFQQFLYIQPILLFAGADIRQNQVTILIFRVDHKDRNLCANGKSCHHIGRNLIFFLAGNDPLRFSAHTDENFIVRYAGDNTRANFTLLREVQVQAFLLQQRFHRAQTIVWMFFWILLGIVFGRCLLPNKGVALVHIWLFTPVG